MRYVLNLSKLAFGLTTHEREVKEAGQSELIQHFAAVLDRQARNVTINFAVMLAAVVLVSIALR